MSVSEAEVSESLGVESASVKTKKNPVKKLLSFFRRSAPVQQQVAAPEAVRQEPLKVSNQPPPKNAPTDWEHKRIVVSEALDEVAAQYTAQLEMDKIIREKQAAAQKAKAERLQATPGVPYLRKKTAKSIY
jgi:hypothetical protein